MAIALVVLAIMAVLVVLFGRSKGMVPSHVASLILGQGILDAGEEIVFIATIPMSGPPGLWSRLDTANPARYLVLTSKSVLLLGLAPGKLRVAQRILFAELVDARMEPVGSGRVCIGITIRVEQKVLIAGPVWTVSGEIPPLSAAELLLQIIQESRPELKLVPNPT